MPSATQYPTSYRQWLAKLISFDTVSRNSNLPLIEYVQAYLRSVGIEPVIVYSPEKTHANLWATLPGEGGVTQGGIVLSGHTDVVPVDGQKWDSDPFQMVEKDGKLFGRGACDMKGFLALVLALTPTFLSMKRAKPVHYAFSYDEEVGCTGVPHLTQYLKEHGFKADGCIIGEPVDMRVLAGAKGMCSWSVEVQGKAIHSSMALMNTSCNAIEYAAMIIAKIREIAIDLRENYPRDPNHNCPFPPITTGTVTGGNAVNTVPAECEFVYSVRVTDDDVGPRIAGKVNEYVKSHILPAMREEFKDANVVVTQKIDLKPFNGDPSSEFTKNALRIGRKEKVGYGAGGNEGGYFTELGIPTVVCGPGPGCMAHMPNEYVLVSQMEESTRFTLDMVKLYCASNVATKGRM